MKFNLTQLEFKITFNEEKMTAPIASIGADVEQSSRNKLTNQSIEDLPGKGNLKATNNAENTAKSGLCRGDYNQLDLKR